MRTWLLWGLAFLLAAGTGFYQRRTGPTWPVRGQIEAGDSVHAYRLLRSGTTGENAPVAVPRVGDRGILQFRRFPTDDEFQAIEMLGREDEFAGALPSQPPAGKLEYYVTVGSHRFPDSGTTVLRFKGPVPAWLLFPHILVMFAAMFIGYRAAFAAIAGSASLTRFVFATTALLTLGGMILGPCVQKYAFGEFWTGWPNGKDLTDNKMLLLWVAWLAAAAVVRFVAHARVRRITVVAAMVVMIGVFLIPHSLRGSQLNYEKLEQGSSPTGAIETG